MWSWSFRSERWRWMLRRPRGSGQLRRSFGERVASRSPCCVLRKVGLIQRIADERGEQDQAGIAVRLEYSQAHVRIVDVEPLDLPAEMRAEEDEAEHEHRPGTPGGAGQPHTP